MLNQAMLAPAEACSWTVTFIGRLRAAPFALFSRRLAAGTGLGMHPRAQAPVPEQA